MLPSVSILPFFLLYIYIMRTVSEITIIIMFRVAAAPEIAIYCPHPTSHQIISDSVIAALVFRMDNGLARYITSTMESF